MSGVTVNGNFERLAKTTEAIKSLGQSKFKRQLSKAMAEESLTQIKLGFREQRDPYGNRWKRTQRQELHAVGHSGPGKKPRKRKDGTAGPVKSPADVPSPQILRKSGRLQNSFKASDSGFSDSLFKVWTETIYAVTHQYGAVIVPKKVSCTGQSRLVFKVGRTTVFAKKVTIPKRQMVPEGSFGEIWWKALADTAEDVFDNVMKAGV